MQPSEYRYTADLPQHVREPRSPAELLAYPLRVDVTAEGRTVYGCSRVELVMEGVPKWVRLPWIATVSADGKVKVPPTSPLLAAFKARCATIPGDVREAVRACALGAAPRGQGVRA